MKSSSVIYGQPNRTKEDSVLAFADKGPFSSSSNMKILRNKAVHGGWSTFGRAILYCLYRSSRKGNWDIMIGPFIVLKGLAHMRLDLSCRAMIRTNQIIKVHAHCEPVALSLCQQYLNLHSRLEPQRGSLLNSTIDPATTNGNPNFVPVNGDVVLVMERWPFPCIFWGWRM